MAILCVLKGILARFDPAIVGESRTLATYFQQLTDTHTEKKGLAAAALSPMSKPSL
jgi:hypothetical protein